MKLLNSIYIKIVSWTVSISMVFVFICNDYAYAQEYIEQLEIQSRLASVNVPFQFGQLVDTFTPPIEKPSYSRIILVQDLHVNYEVQKNIQNIISYLTENYKIGRIGVEGDPADKEVDTSIMSSIKDENIRANTVDYFMEHGMIKGAEGHSSLDDKCPLLIGIEDKALYERGTKLLLSSISRREYVIDYLQKVKFLLKKIEDRIFSKNVKMFRDQYNLFKQKKLSSYAFQKYLKQWSGEANIAIGSLSPEYTKYMVLTEQRNALDDSKIGKEYEQLLKAVNYDYIQEPGIKGAYKNFKNIFTTPESIQKSMIQQIYADNNYSNLRMYIDNVNLSKEINTQNLVKEENKVIDCVTAGLCTSEAEESVLFVCDYVQILIKYLLNQITRNELDEFYRKSAEFETKISRMKAVFPNEIKSIDNYMALLNPFIQEMGEFYKIASNRDEAFVDNFISGSPVKDEKLIMVTGGFHSEGISRELKKRNIPYQVILPRVTSHSQEIAETYYKFLRGDKILSYNELIDERLSLSSFFMKKWFLRRIVARVAGRFIRKNLEEEVGDTRSFIGKIGDFMREWGKGYIRLRYEGEDFDFRMQDAIL